MYFTVFVRTEQVVVKAYLKYATCHRIEILHPVFYHPHFYKIIKFELVAESLDKMKKNVAVSIKAPSSFLDQLLQALRLNLIFTSVIFSSVLSFDQFRIEIF